MSENHGKSPMVLNIPDIPARKVSRKVLSRLFNINQECQKETCFIGD